MATPLKKKRSRSNSKSNSLKPKAIAGAVCACVIIFFLLNKTQSQTTSPVNSVQKKPETVKLRALQAVPIESNPDLSDREIKAIRAVGFKNVKFGVQSLELKTTNGAVKIPVRFQSKKKWCVGGDIDTMRLLSTSEKANELLISIEPLSGDQRGEQYQVSIEKLIGGFEKTFSIKLKRTTESLGLFICSDRTKTKSCRDKEAIDHKVLSDRFADQKYAKSAMNKDYILYFQNFIVKDSRLMTYSNEDVSDDGQADLKRHLVSNFNLKTGEVETSAKFNKAMRSIPTDIKSKKISLTLPYNDPRCLPQ